MMVRVKMRILAKLQGQGQKFSVYLDGGSKKKSWTADIFHLDSWYANKDPAQPMSPFGVGNLKHTHLMFRILHKRVVDDLESPKQASLQ